MVTVARGEHPRALGILTTPCEVGRELRHPVMTPQHSTSTPRWRGRRWEGERGRRGRGGMAEAAKGGDHSVKRIKEGRWVSELGGRDMGVCVNTNYARKSLVISSRRP